MKKFEPFQKILVRDDVFPKWTGDFYSHYDSDEEKHVTITLTKLDDEDILPYAGNEYLICTIDEPEKEILLEEGEMIVCSDYIEALKMGRGTISKFKYIDGINIYPFIDIDGISFKYCIPFSRFKDQNTEHDILCVKNGKIVRYA